MKKPKKMPVWAYAACGILLALLIAAALLIGLRSSAPAARKAPDAAALERLSGAHGLKAGDPANKLYAALPEADPAEQPDGYVLLYAAGLDESGLPLPPYGAIVPSGEQLRAHLVAPRGAEYALADFYIDPATEQIARVEWAVGAQDPLLEMLY